MKPILHTIFIWILSLSLTGMPVAALSQDVADLGQSGKDTATEVAVERGNDMPCHHRSVQAGAKATASQAIEAQKDDEAREAGASMDDDCCCGTDCQCQHDMACQTVGQFSVLAILHNSLFISSPLSSQLIPESVVLYHYRDADLAIIPPIV
jgi:hypothetical protein